MHVGVIIDRAQKQEVTNENLRKWFQKGGAGGTTGLIINNTATDGDPFLAFALSGTQTFTIGVDDGDSDRFISDTFDNFIYSFVINYLMFKSF